MYGRRSSNKRTITSVSDDNPHINNDAEGSSDDEVSIITLHKPKYSPDSEQEIDKQLKAFGADVEVVNISEKRELLNALKLSNEYQKEEREDDDRTSADLFVNNSSEMVEDEGSAGLPQTGADNTCRTIRSMDVDDDDFDTDDGQPISPNDAKKRKRVKSNNLNSENKLRKVNEEEIRPVFCFEDYDEPDSSPPSYQRTLQRKYRHRMFRIYPHFAPSDFCLKKHSMTTFEMLYAYQRELHRVQSLQECRLRWGDSVKAGRHMRDTIDVYSKNNVIDNYSSYTEDNVNTGSDAVFNSFPSNDESSFVPSYKPISSLINSQLLNTVPSTKCLSSVDSDSSNYSASLMQTCKSKVDKVVSSNKYDDDDDDDDDDGASKKDVQLVPSGDDDPDYEPSTSKSQKLLSLQKENNMVKNLSNEELSDKVEISKNTTRRGRGLGRGMKKTTPKPELTVDTWLSTAAPRSKIVTSWGRSNAINKEKGVNDLTNAANNCLSQNKDQLLDTEDIFDNIQFKSHRKIIRKVKKVVPQLELSDDGEENEKIAQMMSSYMLKTEISNINVKDDRVQVKDDRVQCPLCNDMYPSTRIEEHASDCDGIPNEHESTTLPGNDSQRETDKINSYPVRPIHNYSRNRCASPLKYRTADDLFDAVVDVAVHAEPSKSSSGVSSTVLGSETVETSTSNTRQTRSKHSEKLRLCYICEEEVLTTLYAEHVDVCMSNNSSRMPTAICNKLRGGGSCRKSPVKRNVPKP